MTGGPVKAAVATDPQICEASRYGLPVIATGSNGGAAPDFDVKAMLVGRRGERLRGLVSAGAMGTAAGIADDELAAPEGGGGPPVSLSLSATREWRLQESTSTGWRNPCNGYRASSRCTTVCGVIYA